MKRWSPARIITSVALLIAAGVASAAPAVEAGGPNHKTYVATPSATMLVAGVPTDVSVTIANTTKQPQTFGSANITPPAGYSVCSSGGCAPRIDPSVSGFSAESDGSIIKIRSTNTAGISPGSSVTVVAQVTASNGCGTSWTVQVKQSNDFSGTGNDFTGNNVTFPISGGLHLAWTTDAVDVQHDTNMFNADASSAPQVSVVNACGDVDSSLDPLTITATDIPKGDPTDPTTPVPAFTATTTDGVATFGNISYSTWGYDHVLHATASGITDCASDESCYSAQFHVYQLLTHCSDDGETPCAGSGLSDGAQKPRSILDVSASAGTTKDDVLTVDVYPDGSASEFGSCNQPSTSTESPAGSKVVLNVANRTKTVTLELTKSLFNEIPVNGTPFLDICLDVSGSTTSFIDKFGQAVPRPTVTAGLIPDCASSTDTGPCIAKRYKRAANEYININLPAGDPKFAAFP